MLVLVRMLRLVVFVVIWRLLCGSWLIWYKSWSLLKVKATGPSDICVSVGQRRILGLFVKKSLSATRTFFSGWNFHICKKSYLQEKWRLNDLHSTTLMREYILQEVIDMSDCHPNQVNSNGVTKNHREAE